MIDDVVWEEPPVSVRGSGNHREPTFHDKLSQTLRSRPNQWARIPDFFGKNASRTAHRIRKAAVRAYRPAGSFEATCRIVDGRSCLFARYVGETIEEKAPMNRTQRTDAQIAHLCEHQAAFDDLQGAFTNIAMYMQSNGSYENWDLYQRVCDDLGIKPRPHICHPDPED